MVAGFDEPDQLEPGVNDKGLRDFRRLTSLLEQPLAAPGVGADKRPVYHLIVAAKKDPQTGAMVDRYLSDGQWRDIAETYLDRIGLAPRGDELAVRCGGLRCGTPMTMCTWWPRWPGRMGGGCFPATTSDEPVRPRGKWRPGTG